MDFLKIAIKDFLAIGFIELDFTRGTRLILGKNLDSLAADDNGAGKSSVGEAIRWCLYGETVRSSIDKSLDVLHVIRKNSKKAVVWIDVEVDGVIYKIFRSRMKSKAEFTVTCNGRDYKGPAAQEMLDSILPLNVVQFANLVHLDGSYPQLFAPSTDRDRKEILSDLVDIAITQQMQQEATQRLTPLIDRAGDLRGQVGTAKLGIQVAKENKVRLQGEAKGLVKEIRELDQKQTAAVGHRTEAEEEEFRLQHELKEADDAVVIKAEELKESYNEVVDKLQKSTTALETCTDSYLVSELEQNEDDLYSVRTKRDILTNRIEEMEKLFIAGKCPTCGQDTTETLGTDIQSLTSQAERYDDEFAKLRTARKSITEKRQSKIDSTRGRRNKLESERDAIDKEIQSLVVISERKEISAKLSEVRTEIKKWEGRVSSLHAEIKTKRALMASAKDRYLEEDEAIKLKRVALNTAETALIDTDRAIERLSFWKKGFGPKGVPSLFIETVLPQISQRIQKYADLLTGGDVIVTLKAYSETKSKTVREAIQISAVNMKGAAVYGANSTGERNRIDLAVTLGLIDYFKDTEVFESNLLVCDEIFDGLDATGVEQALIALNEAKIPSVLVVSHHEHLKPLFPETLYVQKHKGVSELVA